MPSITLNKERVLNLLGKKVDDKTLKDNISYLGTDLEEINETNIVVEIFPNRPDMLSEEGFARALKTFLDLDSGLKKYELKKGNYDVIIDLSVSKVRPYTACLVAKNIKITDAVLDDIINIQEKLHVTYGRNRKKCAIGVYPLDNISFPVHYRALNPKDINFIPLNETIEMNGYDLLEKTKAGKEFSHLLKDEKKFPVFTDSKNEIMSVPPILNSSKTGTVTTSTKDLFVECSGHDFDVVNKALSMIAAALSDMGSEIYSVNLQYNYEKNKTENKTTPNFESDVISVNIDYVNKYLGVSLDIKEISRLIEKMGFGIKHSNDKNNTKTNIKNNNKTIDVLIPSYRADILHQIDIVEDICIAYGFFNIKDEPDKTSSVGKESFKEKVQEKIRDILVGDGLIENVSYSLIKYTDQESLGLNNIVKIKNPNTSEYDSLRKSLVPTILKNLKNNKMNEYPQKIFEIGRVFSIENKNTVEKNNLCVALCADNTSFTWAKQRLDLLKDLFQLDLEYSQKDYDFFIKGRSAEVKINDEVLGFVGELDINVLRNYELEHAVSLFEIDIDLISNIIEEKNKNQ